MTSVGEGAAKIDSARWLRVNPGGAFATAVNNPELIFAVLSVLLLLLHFPLLRLPYFWDEAGYYIPAARDLFSTGSIIPYSTPSNAHPPLAMFYLALWWKIAGYHPAVTRLAMLLVAAFSLTGFFQLAKRAANLEIA